MSCQWISCDQQRFGGLLIAGAALMVHTVQAGEPANAVPPEVYRGWQAVRQMDCARCHGKHYEGSSGPSLVAAAGVLNVEEFNRRVMDGIPERGMPPYGSVDLVRRNLPGIYQYFLGRARDVIAPGPLKVLDSP